MTLTTVDRNTPYKNQELLPVLVGAGVKILAGTIVCANATGFAAPGATSTTLTYLGMADEAIDNSAGADGDKTVLVRRGKAFQFANHGADPVTQAAVGQACYIVDNQTVAATHGGNTRSKAGLVLAVDAAGVWIE